MLKGISVKRQEVRDVDAETKSNIEKAATDDAEARGAAAVASGADVSVVKFLVDHPERHDINQYWYSVATIEAIAGECVDACDALAAASSSSAKAEDGFFAPSATFGAALVSTPSIFFSLPERARAVSKVRRIDGGPREQALKCRPSRAPLAVAAGRSSTSTSSGRTTPASCGTTSTCRLPTCRPSSSARSRSSSSTRPSSRARLFFVVGGGGVVRAREGDVQESARARAARRTAIER